jgi:O-acetylhomoserine (thiol)-lyase
MEGGIGALAVASGMAAIAYAIQTITEAGDNIVSASTTVRRHLQPVRPHLPANGHRSAFADAKDPASFGKLIDARTKAVYCESVGNPLGNVTDIAALAAVAHAAGVPLIVDNTVPSPYLCRPFEHGADIVVHSLTKYLGGHGTTIGGAIVDSGKFPWAEHKSAFQTPQRTRCELPRRGLHRGAGRCRLHWPRPCGSAAQHGRGAEPAWPRFRYCKALKPWPLRMDRICDNALRVAKHLQTHAKVSWVNYAGLSDHADHGLVKNTWVAVPPA